MLHPAVLVHLTMSLSLIMSAQILLEEHLSKLSLELKSGPLRISIQTPLEVALVTSLYKVSSLPTQLVCLACLQTAPLVLSLDTLELAAQRLQSPPNVEQQQLLSHMLLNTLLLDALQTQSLFILAH